MTQVVDAPDAIGWKDALRGGAFSLQGYDPFPWMSDVAAVQSAPLHCGTPMVLADDAPAELLPWAATLAGCREWICECGFKMDAVTDSAADTLGLVRLAAAKQESLQWELDAAQLTLVQAIRNAAAAGADMTALCMAADMTESELEDVLK
ncbi:hypothetical protein [Arthrobacter crystallopoietes]|uniref:hypothetical protein n=1 Tax=Crystallibacter crystallopoietes TaxID=37928 RepID=UPI001F0CDFDE|nr:hypothetical protein [Arthrobacter crystallopoietes]